MRQAFCNALIAEARRAEFVFLTGDLGFMALEPLREALGNRFINAGVAEQNMVSVAAGLARSGLRPWVYSIAPFVYARPFEQIRNDVCLHHLPVVLVGNGGGYAYGVMGATHHALEDYGAMMSLPNMNVRIPAFDGDVGVAVRELMVTANPTYLRLGLSEEPKNQQMPAYGAWRKIVSGGGATLICVGPLGGGIATHMLSYSEDRRPSVWLLTELPLPALPRELLEDIARSQQVMVVEEHYARGGAGAAIALNLLEQGIAVKKFEHRAAQGYVSGRYGSQKFHRAESGLDASSVASALGLAGNS